MLALAHRLGLPPIVAAGLAIAALAASTGALHEDGLADVADGFGGGATRERKLEIMRDSRIGAFGATALALSLILRTGALAAALSAGLGFAAASLVLVSGVSRAGALFPLALLDPARSEGAGASAGRLDAERSARPASRRLSSRWRWDSLSVGTGRALVAAAASRDRRFWR